MNQIFERITNVDSNNSDAVKETVGSFVVLLQQHGQTNAAKWLDTLQYVIDKYPKYCMPHRNIIETHVAQYLDSDTSYYVIEAAKCEHLLQQVRPINEKNATAKSLWRDQVSLLCEAAHDLIGDVFVHATGVLEKQTKSVSDKGPMSRVLCDRRPGGVPSGVSKESVLCRKLQNIFIFIQAMLVEIYPVAKLVRPQIILDVIIRTLSVTSGDTHNVADSRVAEVKIEALRALDALIHCLGPNLIPFSPLVFRLVMQTLRWSSENTAESFRSVRIQAYNSLSVWLSVLRTHRCESTRGDTRDARARALEDELLAHIVCDVLTPKHAVHINVNIHSTKNMSKKAKRKLANTMLQESNMAAKMNPQNTQRSAEPNDDLAIAALDCAEVFLDTCGLFLKPNTLKTLEEHMVRECADIDRHGERRGLGVCRVLEALRRSAGGRAPYCLHIYATLTACSHTNISRFISQALLNIRMHLHCSPPSLNFVALQSEESNTSKLAKNIMSERNRAALQELLGRDRLSSDEEKNADNITDSEDNDEDVNSNNDSDNTDADDENDEIDSVEVLDSEQTNDEAPPNKKSKYSNGIEDKLANEGDEGVSIEISDTEIETHDLTEIDDIQILEIIDKNKIEESQKQIEVSVKETIHEMQTQLPINETNDAVDGSQNSEHSIEVAYDYPNSAKEKVVIFDETENANLPSTNETDDIELDCGQIIKSSQDITPIKDDKPKSTEELPITNGVSNMDVEIKINIDAKENKSVKNSEVPKVVTAEGEMTVEEMMADFVNEVIEEAPVDA